MKRNELIRKCSVFQKIPNRRDLYDGTIQQTAFILTVESFIIIPSRGCVLDYHVTTISEVMVTVLSELAINTCMM